MEPIAERAVIMDFNTCPTVVVKPLLWHFLHGVLVWPWVPDHWHVACSVTVKEQFDFPMLAYVTNILFPVTIITSGKLFVVGVYWDVLCQRGYDIGLRFEPVIDKHLDTCLLLPTVTRKACLRFNRGSNIEAVNVGRYPRKALFYWLEPGLFAIILTKNQKILRSTGIRHL